MHEQVQLNKYDHHAKLDIHDIYSLQENPNKVLDRAGQPILVFNSHLFMLVKNNIKKN